MADEEKKIEFPTGKNLTSRDRISQPGGFLLRRKKQGTTGTPSGKIGAIFEKKPKQTSAIDAAGFRGNEMSDQYDDADEQLRDQEYEREPEEYLSEPFQAAQAQDEDERKEKERKRGPDADDIRKELERKREAELNEKMAQARREREGIKKYADAAEGRGEQAVAQGGRIAGRAAAGEMGGAAVGGGGAAAGTTAAAGAAGAGVGAGAAGTAVAGAGAAAGTTAAAGAGAAITAVAVPVLIVIAIILIIIIVIFGAIYVLCNPTVLPGFMTKATVWVASWSMPAEVCSVMNFDTAGGGPAGGNAGEPIQPGQCTQEQLVAYSQQYRTPLQAKNSPELVALLECIGERVPAAAGSNFGTAGRGVTTGGVTWFTYDNSYPTCNITRGVRICDTRCSHTQNSCHYGGADDGTPASQQGALAVDFTTKGELGDQIVSAANLCGAKQGVFPGARCEDGDGQRVSCTSPAATHVHVTAASCNRN